MYEHKCSKYVNILYKNIIDKLINETAINQNDIHEINTILKNTILENYNFQYDNPIHRGILLSVITNYNSCEHISCDLYNVLEKTKIYIHNFCK